MAAAADPADEVYEAADFALLSGAVLPRARIVFQTHGRLNARRDNAILFPTWFTSLPASNRWLIGPGKALDPDRHFIVCPGLLGNGQSSSPSNTEAPFAGPDFPAVSVLDNVRLQRRLLAEVYGIDRLALVMGRSMGAQTAFQWAVSCPDRVRAMFALCGSAKTTAHNYAFLDSIKAALQADGAFQGGRYEHPPVDGLRAVGRAYAAWALSAAFYRAGLHLLEEPDIESYLAHRWAGNFLRCDANDLLCMLSTWQRADVASDPAAGTDDWRAALARATMPAIVMPSRTDMYFPPEDSAAAVACMPRAELRVLDSVWGHRAGSAGTDARDIACIDGAIRELLEAAP